MTATFLFVPGHRPSVIVKAVSSAADDIVIDLEDAVPDAEKHSARVNAAQAVTSTWSWVRINESGTDFARADLDALGGLDYGIRIPKVESVEHVEWVRARAQQQPIMCAIETAKGLRALDAIAGAAGVVRLAIGGMDLQRDLGVERSSAALVVARVNLVVASRAAGLEPPIDSVFGDLRDPAGLRAEAVAARDLGMGGKSAIHPKQIASINSVFSLSDDDLARAARIVAAFQASGGEATVTVDGDFVDRPVAARARRLLGT